MKGGSMQYITSSFYLYCLTSSFCGLSVIDGSHVSHPFVSLHTRAVYAHQQMAGHTAATALLVYDNIYQLG